MDDTFGLPVGDDGTQLPKPALDPAEEQNHPDISTALGAEAYEALRNGISGTVQKYATAMQGNMSSSTPQIGPLSMGALNDQQLGYKPQHYTQEQADQVYKDAGVGEKAPDATKYNQNGINYLAGQAQRDQLAQQTLQEINPIYRTGGELALGLLDPANLALGAFPAEGVLSAAGQVANKTFGTSLGMETAAKGIGALKTMGDEASTLTGRVAARAGSGAIEGTAAMTGVTALTAPMDSQMGQDQSAAQIISNIAFGGAFGAIGHVGFGGLAGGGGGDKIPEQPPVIKEPTQSISADIKLNPDGTATQSVYSEPGTPQQNTQLNTLHAGAPVTDGVEFSGDKHNAQYAVVDGSELKANIGKGNVQPRDRTTPASQAQINEIANNMDPKKLLNDTLGADKGAPTITADNQLVAGNGRVEGINSAYDNGKGEAYRNMLMERAEDYGLDPEVIKGMSKPILVRQITDQNVDAHRLSILSNISDTAPMSALEQSAIDSENIKGFGNFYPSSSGEVNTASNTQFIQDWISHYKKVELPSLLASDGRLSAQGTMRLRNAILHKAFGDSPTLSRIVDSADSGIKVLSNALIKVAPKIADFKDSVAKGAVHPIDISKDIEAAVHKYGSLKDQTPPVTVKDYYANHNLFDDGLSPEATTILKFFGDFIRSSQKIAKGISDYYTLAEEKGVPGGMLSELTPDKIELMDKAFDLEPTVDDLLGQATPDTRANVFKAAVGQMLDEKYPAVDAALKSDPNIGKATIDDVKQDALQANSPDNNITTSGIPDAPAVKDEIPFADKVDYAKETEKVKKQIEDVEKLKQLGLYSKTVEELPKEKTSKDMLMDAAGKLFGGDVQKIMDFGKLEIVNSVNELPGWHPDDVKGMFHNGKTWLVADNMNMEDLEGTILHEIGEHANMETMLGTKMYNDLLDQMDKHLAGNDELRGIVDNAVPKDTPEGIQRRERLAYMLENTPEAPYIQNMIAKIRAWIYKTFPSMGKMMSLSDQDIRHLGIASLRNYADRLSDMPGDMETWRENLTDKQMKPVAGEYNLVEGGSKELDNRYIQAAQAKPVYDNFIKSIADEFGLDAKTAALKGRDRSVTKIVNDYNGEPELIKDLLRGSIETPDLETAKALLDKMITAKVPLANVEKNVKTLLDKDTPDGYKDAKLIINVNGTPAELIILPKFMSETKGAVHGLYEERQKLTNELVRIQDSDLPEDINRSKQIIEQRDNLNAQMQAKFQAAEDAAGLRLSQTDQSSSALSRLQGSASESTLDKLNGLLTGSNAQQPYRSGPLNTAIGLDSKSKNLADSGSSAIGDLRSTDMTSPPKDNSIIPQNAPNDDVKYSRAGQTADDSKIEMDALNAVMEKTAKVRGILHGADLSGVQDAKGLQDAIATGGVKISSDDAKHLYSEIQRAYLRAKDDNDPDPLHTAIDKAMDKLDYGQQAYKLQLVTDQNVKARLGIYLKQWAGFEKDGLTSIFMSTRRQRPGSRELQMGAEIHSTQAMYAGNFDKDLMAGGVQDAFYKGIFNDDVMRAQEALDAGKSTDHLPKEAVTIAQAIIKAYDGIQDGMRKSGLMVNKVKNYFANQQYMHDEVKIRNTEAPEWISDVRRLGDLKAMAEAMNVRVADLSSKNDIMQGMYDGLSTGEHIGSTGNLGGTFTGDSMRVISQKPRKIIFKSADAAIEYRNKYSSRDYQSSVIGTINANCKKLAVLKTLGPSYERNIKEIAENFRKSSPVLETRKRLRAWIDHDMMNQLKSVDGRASRPSNELAARVCSTIRAVKSMDSLGFAPISALTDVINSAGFLNRMGMGSNTLFDSLINMGKQFRSFSDEHKQLLAGNGVFTDGLMNDTYRDGNADGGVPGWLAKKQAQFFKISGLHAWDERMKLNSLDTLMNRMAKFTDKKMDELDPSLQKRLGLFSIDSEAWDTIRKVNTAQLDGRNYLATSEFDSLRPHIEADYIAKGLQDDLLQKATDKRLDQLKGQYFNFLMDGVQHMFLAAPDTATRYWMQGKGLQSGSFAGETARFIAQFKSFQIGYLRRALFDQMYQNHDSILFGKNSYMADMSAAGLKQKAHLAGYVAALTMGGMAVNTIKDILKGKEPRSIFNPDGSINKKTIMAGFTQGGGSGIYGDFLFGDYNRFGGGLLETAAGPMAGTLSDAARIYSKARDNVANGKPADVGSNLTKFVASNTPFVNLYYTSAAFNYLFVNTLQEYMNPGYLARQEDNMRQQTGQNFAYPPSQYLLPGVTRH
jgi:hypothetical protein